MVYNKIVNPETGRSVYINGKLGRNIIKKYLIQIGGENNADKLMDLLYQQAIEKKNIDDDDIYLLFNSIQNNDELYNSIYEMNRKLRNLGPDSIKLFIQNVYRFQELPQLVKDLKPCKFHAKRKCKRDNIIHLQSHTFLHPATLIAQSLLLLNKKI